MQFLIALATYVVLGTAASLPVFALTRRMQLSPFVALLIGWGSAPVLISYFLYVAFLVFPHMPRSIYIIMVVVPFLFIAAAFRFSISAFLGALRSRVSAARKPGSLSLGRLVVVAAILAIAVYVTFVSIAMPMIGTDALRHATIGRTLARDLSLEHYPLRAPLADGTLMNTLYPPGLHLFYAWIRLASPEPEDDVGTRTVSAFYFLLLLWLVWTWAEAIHGGAGLFAALLLACVPSLAVQFAGNSIDAMRLFFFSAPFYWMSLTRMEHSRASWALLGLLLLLSATVHSTNLIAFPVLGLCILLFGSSLTLAGRLLAAAAVCSVSGLLGGVEYLRRVVLFGQLKAPSLYFGLSPEALVDTRGLTELGPRIWRGYLQIFTEPYQHGLVAVAYIVSVAARRYRALSDTSLAGLVYAAGLSSLVLVWVLPGPVPGWSNSRYALTVAPLAAVGGSLLIAGAIPLFQQRSRLPLLGIAAGLVVALLVGGVYLTPSFVAQTFSPDGILSAATIHKIEVSRWMAVLGGALFGIPFALWRPREFVAVKFGACAIVAGAAAAYPLLGTASSGPPLAALVCACGVAAAMLWARATWAAPLRGFAAAAKGPHGTALAAELPFIICGLLVMIPMLTNPPLTKGIGAGNLFGLKLVLASEEEKLRAVGSGTIDSVLYIRAELPSDALTLVTEDTSFFYYSRHPGIYWTDRRMAEFRSASSREAAVAALQGLGISYIQVSERVAGSAAFAESHLMDIIGDPAYAQLAWSAGGSDTPTKVYRLLQPNP